MKKDYIRIFLGSNDLGKRIDIVLSMKLKNISRNRLQSLIKQGFVNFNKQSISDRSFIPKEIGVIDIRIPEPKKKNIIAEKIDLDIVYEDNNLIIINKKPGLVVHPGAGNYSKTLVNGLMYHCKGSLSGIGGVLRPGIVHRIDKMTSGLLLVAKNDFTHVELSKQFKNRSIEKEYVCITYNVNNLNSGEIKKNISRSKFNRKKMAVCTDSEGKLAITKYKLLKQFRLQSLVFGYYQCKLETGRTHQIRVHFESINCPLIGDDLYKKKLSTNKLSNELNDFIKNKFLIKKRQALHAKSLSFIHPQSKKKVFFEAKEPRDFSDLLSLLENEHKKLNINKN